MPPTSESKKRVSPKVPKPRDRKALFTSLYLIIAICFIAAWFAPVRNMVSRRIRPRQASATRDAYGFIAIAYTHPASGTTGLHSRIHEHLDTLTANGYVPITLADTVQLMDRGTPVPRKAVLLTVDACCRRLLQDTRSAARRHGWNGVVFLDPESPATGHGAVPDRRMIQAFERSRDWDVGLLSGSGSAIHDLVFTLGSTGRNTMFGDRRRLNRMTVDPEVSASDLIAAMKSANREIESVEDADRTRKATGWIAERGRMAFSDSGLEIRTGNGTDEACAWLAGSDVRRDFSASLDFRMQNGIASFYARATADRSSYILVEFAPDGDAVLRQKSVLHDPPVTLARTKSPVRGGRPHRLAVFMRDGNINVTVDGLPVFNTHEQSAGVKTAGLMGIRVKAASLEQDATLVVDHVVLQARRSTLVSWDFDASLDPYVIRWIRTHGSRLTEISPPLDRLQGLAGEPEPGQRSLYRHLARLYNLRLTPCIHISSAKELGNWPPVSLAGILGNLDCDGLYVNFEKFSDLQVRDLEVWLRQTGRLLSGAGRPVLVRLPRMLERLSAVYTLLAQIPSVEIVTDAHSLAPLSSVQAKQIIEERIATPSPAAMNALPPVFTVADIPAADLEKPVDKQIRELIDAGETAFLRASYEGAIAAFSEWHRLAPSSPVPLRRIGDALANLGYADEAIGFHRQSLDLDPGQIDLAARLARLLMETGRKTEARNLLNAFSRLFPDSADVLLAQAEWLYRENRTEEAADRVQRVLRMDPDHFEATLFLLRIAEDEASRSTAIEHLMNIGKTPDRQYNLVAAIQEHDLLTYNNSHLLIAVMDRIARQNSDPRIQEIILAMEPLATPVSDDFATPGTFEKHWQVEGAVAALDNGRLNIQANPARSEFNVRLMRSERWRDSYIEASVDEVKGGFWLYARRSRHHLVRFGFDPGIDRLHLQVWKGRNNDIVASRNIPWSFPSDGCSLRLEIRGKGVSGLVNGVPVFEVPLALPEDLGLGWTAFSVQSADRGKASAALRSLSSGPLPVRIALAPSAPASDDEGRQTARLRARLGMLTDISPDWFSVDESGSWSSVVREESDFYRLFARYYRLRLTPSVRVGSGNLINADDIITVCRTHGYDGLILRFDTMPDSAWFERMDLDLNAPGLDVLAIVTGPSGTSAIRGIASSRTLFKKYGAAVPLEIVGETETETVDSGFGSDPVLFRY